MIHRVLRLQGPQARGPAGNTGVLQNPPESSCHATGCRAAGEGFKTQNFSVEITPELLLHDTLVATISLSFQESSQVA